MTSDLPYDALLIVSFGGPEGPEEVMPFLENVLRGKNVPRERMMEVAKHYQNFGGVSPINQQCRDLISALRQDFADHDLQMPIYWGNRNWHPLLPDTIEQMRQDGVRRALAFFTSTFSCYSGCRQYRENIRDACLSVGEDAPTVEKLRMPFNHPLFIEASTERVQQALEKIPKDRRPSARIVFTAHSIPMTMAIGSNYEIQLRETCRLIMERIGMLEWKLVFQSRSGPPTQPWLEPDICDYLAVLKNETDVRDVVIMPVGFVSDHMEVMFDLDTEARQVCEQLGINMERAATVGMHPKFVSMIRELIVERTTGAEKRAVGNLPASHDVCPKDCCQYEPLRRPVKN